MSSLAPSIRWSLLSAALVTSFLPVCASTRKGADAKSALFADLKAGWHIAGIPLEQWKDVPDEAEFQKRPIARNTGRYSKDLSQVVLEGIRLGDFADVRLEFQEVTRERRAEEMVQNPKLDAFYSFKPVLGVIAKPLWRDPSPSPGAGANDEKPKAALPPPRPAGVAAQLARFGLTLGKPYALSWEFGVIFEAKFETKNFYRSYASLAPGEQGKEPQLGAILREYEREFFERDDRRLLTDLDKHVRGLASQRSLTSFLRWKQAALAAAAAGVDEPAALFAGFEREANEAMSHSLKRFNEEFDDAGLPERFLIQKELVIDAAKAATLTCEVPPVAVQALRRSLTSVAQQLDTKAREASEAKRELAAQTYALLARSLREDRSLESKHPAGAIEASQLAGLPNRLTGCAWVAGKAAAFEDKSLIQKLDLHAQLCVDTTRSGVVAAEFLALESAVLAAEYEAAARTAAKMDLHATACARLLIANGLRTNGQDKRSVASALSQAQDYSTGSDTRSEMEREGLALAARLVPLVDWSEFYGDRDRAYDGSELLAGTPFSALDRLGLIMGTGMQQRFFAQARSAPLLKLSISPPVIDAITSTTRTELLPKTIYTDKIVSNDAAVTEWLRKRDENQRALDRTENGGRGIDNPYYFPPRTGGTVTFGQTTYATGETLESYKKHMEYVESYGKEAARIRPLRDKLIAESNELYRNPPPDKVLQTVAREVKVPREVQEWRVKFSRDVELIGDAVQHKHGGSMEFTFVCYRVRANPDNEVEAVDGWKSQEQVRADQALFDDDDTRSKFASFGLAHCLVERQDAYETELGARGLSEVEVQTERRWMRYFFTPVAAAKPDSPAGRQRGVVELAFTKRE